MMSAYMRRRVVNAKSRAMRVVASKYYYIIVTVYIDTPRHPRPTPIDPQGAARASASDPAASELFQD